MAERLKLVSHKLCPYVQRAVIALTEKGVPFERIDIDLANKPDWFLKISPLGKVPVLVVAQDGREVALFESNRRPARPEVSDESVTINIHVDGSGVPAGQMFADNVEPCARKWSV